MPTDEIEELICLAIKDSRVIKLTHRDVKATVKPAHYFVNQDGQLILHAYVISHNGALSNDNGYSFRFEMKDVEDIEITKETFDSSDFESVVDALKMICPRPVL